jgi:hypothetical protein
MKHSRAWAGITGRAPPPRERILRWKRRQKQLQVARRSR